MADAPNIPLLNHDLADDEAVIRGDDALDTEDGRLDADHAGVGHAPHVKGEGYF